MTNQQNTPSNQQRLEALVEKLVTEKVIINQDVESAFLVIPRHHFLPDVEPEIVYADKAIAVKRDKRGFITSSSSQPTMMALMLHQLQLNPGDNVLEIGTATGYNAALMRHLVGKKGYVTSIELDKDLAEQAKNNLMQANIHDVLVINADGSIGYDPRAAYDKILVTASVWDIPPAWITQLKPKGRLVLPIAIDGIQISAAFVPQSDGTLYSHDNLPCAFVNLRGEFASPSMAKQVGSTSLYIYADEVEKVDAISLHLLLSDDYTSQFVGDVNIWQGFQNFLMLHEPQGYVFSSFAVLGDKKVYGIEGRGVALFAPASAVFLPYASKGYAHCYAGSDACMMIQQCAKDWKQKGSPSAEALRIRLIPKKHGKPNIAYGKLYTRPNHYMHVWIDIESNPV